MESNKSNPERTNAYSTQISEANVFKSLHETYKENTLVYDKIISFLKSDVCQKEVASKWFIKK